MADRDEMPFSAIKPDEFNDSLGLIDYLYEIRAGGVAVWLDNHDEWPLELASRPDRKICSSTIDI